MPHELRPAKAEDLGFVTDSWRRSYERAPHSYAPSLEAYIRTQRRVVEQCLSTSETTIAHWPGEPDHILGWVCYRREPVPVVHYLFVKQVYRTEANEAGEVEVRRGLGTALLEHAAGPTGPIWTTHARRLGIWRRRIIFCPALIFE